MQSPRSNAPASAGPTSVRVLPYQQRRPSGNYQRSNVALLPQTNLSKYPWHPPHRDCVSSPKHPWLASVPSAPPSSPPARCHHFGKADEVRHNRSGHCALGSPRTSVSEYDFRQKTHQPEATGPTGREGMAPQQIGRERGMPEPTTRETAPSNNCSHPPWDLGAQCSTH